MTLYEATLSGKNYVHEKESLLQHTRLIVAETYNAGVIARGGKIRPKDLKKPTDVVRLISDGKMFKEINEKAMEKPSQELRDLAIKHGLIKQKKKGKSLSEIFTKNKAS